VAVGSQLGYRPAGTARGVGGQNSTENSGENQLHSDQKSILWHRPSAMKSQKVRRTTVVIV
jgi:hypothetical protein